MGEFIKVECNDSIALVTISRPKAMNALNPEVLKELDRVFAEIAEKNEAKVIILTGEGKAFVAGADIACMKDMDPDEAVAFSELGHRVFDNIAACRLTTIAAINGYALGGGCELAMACDIRVASEKAKIGIPEVTLGVFPAFAGTQRLPRLVGLGNALELLATGAPVDAQRAQAIGLVNHVVSPEELIPFCRELAAKIARNSTSAIDMGKRLMKQGLDMDMEKALRYEATMFGLSFTDPDQKEGMTAFVEKRKPNFR